MRYPLELNFKKLAIAQQIYVRDAGGQLLWYVKQKAFKLKEAITVYGDEEQTRPLFTMQADRVLDFSARYALTDAATQQVIGVVQRKGMRSFWRAKYEVERNGQIVFELTEENPMVKVIDRLLFEIPLVGLISGYIFHPRYLATRPGGSEVLRLQKEPAFLQGKFSVEQLTQLDDRDETLAVLSMLMLVLLERARG
ncbi:MAG TPA: hypothetical protein VF035_07545 [Longimicrobiales bacterium]